MKRGRLEPEALTFSCYAHGLDNTPDLDPPDETACRSTSAWSSTKRGSAALLECYSASTARNGLVYILGEILEVSDPSGPSSGDPAATTSASASHGRAAISTVS